MANGQAATKPKTETSEKEERIPIDEREFDLTISTAMRRNYSAIRELERDIQEIHEINSDLASLYVDKEIEKRYGTNITYAKTESGNLSYKIQKRKCGFR